MESQSQNPEFRINPENFHPCFVCIRHFVGLSRQLYYLQSTIDSRPQYSQHLQY